MVAQIAHLPELAELTPEGMLRFKIHEGQQEAIWSEAQINLVLAGTQGGKTAIGPLWMLQEMKACGPGDYLVVGPTFSLLEIKAIPEFLRLFKSSLNLGDYVSSPVRKFTLSEHGERFLFGSKQLTPTNVYFGYGSNPDSLESSTAKAAWLDEAGQKEFRADSWEAIRRRLSIAQGRILITTTPYNLGWLKTRIYDKRDDPLASIKVVNFPSTANPKFPIAEFERARRELPPWKFNMFYRGLFERPAGMIYGSFTEKNKMPWFEIPESWPRFLGLDFGGVNTAAIFLAREMDSHGQPTAPPRYFAYREYHKGGKTAKQHAESILLNEPRMPTAFGGSKSEGQWRQEFASGGLGINPPPISDVEVGINRVYGAFARGELIVLDNMAGLLDELGRYSRPLDANGEPMEGIEDKETFHHLDSLRYAASWIWHERRRPAVH